MCGRFALGAHAEQLAADIHQQYFVRPPPPRQQQPPAGAGGAAGGSSHAASSGAPSSQTRPRAQDESASQDDHPVQWASLETQDSFRPRYNVAPTTKVPVLRRSKKDPNAYELDLLKWGLVPHWYSDPPAPGLSTINATCESVFQGTPAWRGPRQDKRCVVLAQGFYEWLDKGKEKQPYFVKRKDGRLMAFAGLWDHCDFKGNLDPVTSFTILTVPVNEQLKFLHTRMPAILDTPSEVQTWLSAAPWSDELKALIRPYEGELETYAVDRGVGKVQNDSEEFVKPLAEKKGSLDSLFAKQAASTSKAAPGSKSAFKSPNKSAKKEDAEAMNPDEDDDEEKLQRIEAGIKGEQEAKPDVKSSRKKKAAPTATSPSASSGKRKRSSPSAVADKGKKGGKNDVEVIELDDSDGSDAEVIDVKPPPGKRKKVKAGSPSSRPNDKPESKHSDGEGNEVLTDFFSVEPK